MKTLFPRIFALAMLALPVAAPTAVHAQRVDPVYIEDRLNQMQQSITLLTGQLEQLQYKNQQLQQQLEKLQADYDYRLETLEKGKPGAGGPRPAPPPQAAHAPPAGGGTLAPPAAGNTAGNDQLYHDGYKMMLEGDYAGAERAFKTFLQQNPRHVLAGNAQYWLGESYYARRDYQNAAVAFAEGYKVYKNNQKGPDSLLKLGVTLSILGKKQEACAMFARFNQDYPNANVMQKKRVDQERQKAGCG